MQLLAPGVFQVTDNETITITAKSTGSSTLFGVNYSIFGGGEPLTEGQPKPIVMQKSKAQGASTVSNAKSTSLTLLFSFTSDSGGRYEWTMTGSGGGDPFNDFTDQAGKTPNAIFYTFHIV
jgi:hypothetical protein